MNTIPIKSWTGEPDDRELQRLIPTMEKLSAAVCLLCNDSLSYNDSLFVCYQMFILNLISIFCLLSFNEPRLLVQVGTVCYDEYSHLTVTIT